MKTYHKKVWELMDRSSCTAETVIRRAYDFKGIALTDNYRHDLVILATCGKLDPVVNAYHAHIFGLVEGS